MAIVCNFTPDEIEWQHVGIIGVLKPGDIKEFPDARAAHILNQFGPRGVLRYSLEDDPDKKREESIRIYKRFWMHQITTFNQSNEAKKNEKLPYSFPTEQLKEKAEEMGIELIAPWTSQPKTDSAQVAELKAENKELRTLVDELKKNQEEMLKVMKEIGQKPAVPHTVETGDLIKKFITLDKAKYKNWVTSHANDLADWPDSVVEKAKEKWSAFYPDMEWPLPD